MTQQWISELRRKKPLVHHITNYVTVNDCANAVLAIGGSPIMADASSEVEEIISICNALVINIGTLNERTIQSMLLAAKKANALGKPVILDPVGAGASTLRTETAKKLLDEVRFTVIRGNASEIKTLLQGAGKTQGVDVSEEDMITSTTLDSMIQTAKTLNRLTGAVIVITGAKDIIVSDTKTAVISNGVPEMGAITGTGCMLSAISGAFCATIPDTFEAMTAAVSVMGLSGELAYEASKEKGTGSFRVAIIDTLSKMDDSVLGKGAKIEYKE